MFGAHNEQRKGNITGIWQKGSTAAREKRSIADGFGL